MDLQRVIEFLKNSGDISVIKVLKQHWKQEKYRYHAARPRPDYGLMLPLCGEVKILTEDVLLTARAGDVIFLPKYAHYEAVFERETDDYLVNFDMAGEGTGVSVPLRLLENAPLSVSEGFDSLIREEISGNLSDLRRKGLLYLLIDSIVSGAFTETSVKFSTMEKAKKLLRDACNMKVAEIAACCGMSESGFRKEFKRVAGMSPNDYRLNCRLSKAKYLLESTDLDVGAIAETLGFYDSAYFCRVFKKCTGVSPLQYARRKQL